MPGSEPPVGAALRRDERPDSCIPPRPLWGMQQAVKPESPGLSRRRERAGIPVPNIGRAATSGSIRQDQRAHRQVLEKVL